MEIVEEELATVEAAQAYQIDDVLLVRLSGTKPTPCHLVSIERALTDVEPPAFVARTRIDPRRRCIQVVTPFESAQAFRIGMPRGTVLVHHAAGVLTVEVEELDIGTRGAPAAPEAFLGPYDGVMEAHGYSKKYDLGEAIRDAMEKLGSSQGGTIPDWLSTYTVVAMQVEVGGIAGFNHLKVTLRGR